MEYIYNLKDPTSPGAILIIKGFLFDGTLFQVGLKGNSKETTHFRYPKWIHSQWNLPLAGQDLDRCREELDKCQQRKDPASAISRQLEAENHRLVRK